MDFTGKTAVVTGAAGGMGAQVARDLDAAGAHVVGIDRQPPGDPIGERTRFAQLDLTEDGAVKQVMAEAYQESGRLDYLVNAAGVLWFDRDESALEIDLAVWDQVLTIDLKSMVHTARHAVPWMRRTGGGAMVHVSSTQCLRGDDRPQDAYQAAKAGVLALSKSLAIQLAPDRIRSNALLPGPTASPMQARWDDAPDARDAVARAIPLGRVGTPQDMAGAILFLLSDQAGFITGTELLVDGGLLARP